MFDYHFYIGVLEDTVDDMMSHGLVVFILLPSESFEQERVVKGC